MKIFFYFSIRIISLVLLIPVFVAVIPGFVLMILADEINPEDVDMNNELKEHYNGN